mgnify:CR=1 FL=1
MKYCEPTDEKYLDFGRAIVTYNVSRYYRLLQNLNVYLKKDVDNDNLPSFQRTGVKNTVIELHIVRIFFKSNLCNQIFETMHLGDCMSVPKTLENRFRREYGDTAYNKIMKAIAYWDKGGQTQ